MRFQAPAKVFSCESCKVYFRYTSNRLQVYFQIYFKYASTILQTIEFENKKNTSRLYYLHKRNTFEAHFEKL